VTDAGLVHLHDHPALKEVFLADCEGVTDAGVERLKQALSGVKVQW